VAATLSNLSWFYLLTQEYVKSEQSAREAWKLDSTELRSKAYIAHALLFQGHYAEAEKIYKELLQANEHEVISDNFDELKQAGAIPEERKGDVEKIRLVIK